jgi:hypothetical protein
LNQRQIEGVQRALAKAEREKPGKRSAAIPPRKKRWEAVRAAKVQQAAAKKTVTKKTVPAKAAKKRASAKKTTVKKSEAKKTAPAAAQSVTETGGQ